MQMLWIKRFGKPNEEDQERVRLAEGTIILNPRTAVDCPPPSEARWSTLTSLLLPPPPPPPAPGPAAASSSSLPLSVPSLNPSAAPVFASDYTAPPSSHPEDGSGDAQIAHPATPQDLAAVNALGKGTKRPREANAGNIGAVSAKRARTNSASSAATSHQHVSQKPSSQAPLPPTADLMQI
ncbi:hypothetical protein A0H81_14046 [Grifola frondosa]|uniref:Uncharacterized protein n=1 Tax=Grifola frondosa TaxID=5627 RepID=A0A1C7LN01_GRIFR|nr:hypothetical protein A0H81_14046 [Grifola frondosa]